VPRDLFGRPPTELVCSVDPKEKKTSRRADSEKEGRGREEIEENLLGTPELYPPRKRGRSAYVTRRKKYPSSKGEKKGESRGPDLSSVRKGDPTPPYRGEGKGGGRLDVVRKEEKKGQETGPARRGPR